MLKILVIDERQQRAAEICQGLLLAGHQVAAVLASADGLSDKVAEIRPDVILIETDAPSRDTLEHLAVVDRTAPRPILMFASDADNNTIRHAIRAGVSTYMVDGIDPSRLKPVIDVAVAHFETHQSLKQELAEATKKLSERKVIDKAKGLLMKHRGLDEDAAYSALRKLAMDKGQPMAKVANDLIEAASILL